MEVVMKHIGRWPVPSYHESTKTMYMKNGVWMQGWMIKALMANRSLSIRSSLFRICLCDVDSIVQCRPLLSELAIHIG